MKDDFAKEIKKAIWLEGHKVFFFFIVFLPIASITLLKSFVFFWGIGVVYWILLSMIRHNHLGIHDMMLDISS